MENWRQFVNETRLPSGDPFQRKATKKRFEAALGRSVEKGEVIALDDKFHQVFKIAKQMKVWLATDEYGRARLYDDMKEACNWARISCPTPEPEPQPEPEPEPEEEPQEEPQEEPEEEEEEEGEYRRLNYSDYLGF